MSKETPLSDTSDAAELPQANTFVDLEGKRILAVGSAATMFLAAVAIAGHELRKHHASHQNPQEPDANP